MSLRLVSSSGYVSDVLLSTLAKCPNPDYV